MRQRDKYTTAAKAETDSPIQRTIRWLPERRSWGMGKTGEGGKRYELPVTISVSHRDGKYSTGNTGGNHERLSAAM